MYNKVARLTPRIVLRISRHVIAIDAVLTGWLIVHERARKVGEGQGGQGV